MSQAYPDGYSVRYYWTGAMCASAPSAAHARIAGPRCPAQEAIEARLAQRRAIRLGMAAFDEDSARHAADLMREAFGLEAP